METTHGAPICFIDTETTSLGWDRRAWEIGIITRNPGQPDTEHHWFVDAADLDLANADTSSLHIGRYWERHPQYHDGTAHRERDVMRQVEQLTRGAHLAGAVPSFDAHVLTRCMRRHHLDPGWHYHLIDVETLAAGYLRGLGLPTPPLPWSSDELSRRLGVTTQPGQRHTALGDARWAAAIWDAVMDATPPDNREQERTLVA